MEEINHDYDRFTCIEKAFTKYYQDKRYESEFVETVYIADGHGISDDLKRYLEEELFVSVVVRRVDIARAVNELAVKEVNNAV
jgi:hypothetical protein